MSDHPQPRRRVANPTPARRADATPLYEVIVRTLQSEIVRGIYPVGSQLPSETALMERFRVSRHTVRQAMRGLREGGLVKPHQGLGTIVQRPGGHQGYVHRINTISDLFPLNVETHYEPVNGVLVQLPEWALIAQELSKDSTWLPIHGSRMKPGASEPFNELHVFVAARFAGVGRVLGTHSVAIYSVLEMIYGETISEVDQFASGFIATADRGARIGMSPGEPGIEVRRIYRIQGNHDVALISFNRYRADDFTFSMTLRRIRDA